MTKINDFCLVGGLGLLVVGSNDRVLRIYEIKIRTDENDKAGDIGDVWLETKGKVLKGSDSRILQLTFDSKQSLVMCLSSDNQLEIFKVINSHEGILKKLVKREKKAALKRTHSEM